MNQLIINADDFGLSEGVTRGIVRCMLEGVVSTTTAMVCVDGSPALIQEYAQQVPVRVGLHLQVTGGTPVLPAEKVPSLVDESGRFPKNRKGLGTMETQEVLAEWRAQAERLQSLGVTISHIDAHHHTHAREDTLPAYVQLAKELGVPARQKGAMTRKALQAAGVEIPDLFVGSWYAKKLSSRCLGQLVAAAFTHLGGGVVELMCHPAEIDEPLRQRSVYVREREKELRTLIHPRTKARFEAMGVEVLQRFAVA